MMRTLKAFKVLQQAGIDARHAEAMVEVFTDMQQRQPGAQTGKQLDQIQSKTHCIDIRLSQLQTNADETHERLDQLMTKAGLPDDRLGHIERKTDKLTIRFTQLAAKVDKLDFAFREMNTRFENLRNDVVTLTTDLRWMKRLSILMTTTLLAAVLKDILL